MLKDIVNTVASDDVEENVTKETGPDCKPGNAPPLIEQISDNQAESGSTPNLDLDRSSTNLDMGDGDVEGGAVSDTEHISHSRSKTMPIRSSPPHKKAVNINLDRLKNAKLTAEKAMKNHKVFLIQGPYPAIRQSLRERGWVEKFHKIGVNPPPKKSPRNKKKRPVAIVDEDDQSDDDDDDTDDDPDADDPNDHGGKVPPWEEDNGIYGIMSRIVRNSSPTFIWSVSRNVVDPKALRKDQMINHYGKAGSFTTKVGLCINMRNLTWFQECHPDTFFPRCYRLSHEEEKQAFIDDYRLTACINLLKHLKEQHENPTKKRQDDDGSNVNETERDGETSDVTDNPATANSELEKQLACTNPECTKSRPNATQVNKCIHASGNSPRKGQSPLKKKKVEPVPLRSVEVALSQCMRYLRSINHHDVDEAIDIHYMSDSQWDEFVRWYYRVIHDGAQIRHTDSKMEAISAMLDELKCVWPQYELDGCRNVWMVKAGAKSRGRGIIPHDRLEDMLKLVSAQVVQKESKYVVQKYIERPLLIYNTKFDIRQWFLVTDWNPLTIWFYKDSYLRFCSQEYTLEKFDEAIHLSNNAIQKNYTNGPRSKCLPADNMWTCRQFKNYIKLRGHDNVWEEVIYPGMKEAVVGSLLCSQDIVEYRKGAFELYGADFMLTEDFKPWLIEINSSPSMTSSTKVTSKLCSSVLADTIKVVIDRKWDKYADTGNFELAYKQPQVSVPPYIGTSLSVDGAGIKRPAWMIPRKVDLAPDVPKVSLSSPRVSSTVQKAGENSQSHKVFKQNYTHSDNSKLTDLATGPSTKQTGTTKSTPSFSSSKANQQSNFKVKPSRTPVKKSPVKTDTKTDTEDSVKLSTKTTLSGTSVEAVPAKSKAKHSRSSSAKVHVRRNKVSSSRSVDNKCKNASSDDADVAIPSDAEDRLSVANLSRPSSVVDKVGLEDESLRHSGQHTLSDEIVSRQLSDGPLPEDSQQYPVNGIPYSASAPVMRTQRSSRQDTLTKPTLHRNTEDKPSISLQTQSHAEFTEQQKLFDKSTSDKLLLPLKSAETVDIQALHYDVSSKGYVMSSPLMDSQWGKTCNQCGNGMNLKLENCPAAPCQCQRDGVRTGTEQHWNPRSASTLTRGALALTTGTSGLSSLPLPLPQALAPHPPQRPPSPTLPKRIHIDKNKLVSSVYAKTQSCQLGLNHNNPSGKFVLKYTDANIQKPEGSSKLAPATLPKLITRYVGRKGAKDSLPTCIDSYKQSKLTIVTQSFQ